MADHDDTAAAPLPPELEAVLAQLADAGRAAEGLAGGLTAEQGAWRPAPAAWSVAECLDHLATANRVYLGAMEPAAARARQLGRVRQRPATPGWAGRLFVASLEPPPRWWNRLPAPRSIRPRPAPALADAHAAFLSAHAAVRDHLLRNADLDLAGVRFRNPFVPGARFSLATGLHVIVAHERRHLAQAERVRRAAVAALPPAPG